MKATKIFLTFVAAATMMFASCGKDDNNNENVNNNTPTEATENTLLYNGKLFQMTSTYRYEQSGRVYIDAYAVETLDNNMPIFHIISDNPGNGTYDITNGGGVFFGLTSEVDYITSFGSHSTYTSGAVTIEKDDNAFRMRMSGTLENGTTVAFHIYVPASEWTEVIYD